MKVLVTGATGFLGSHIVDACDKKKYQVRVLVRESSDISYLEKFPSIEFAYGDITDPDSLDEATRGIDVVFHSAARTSDWGTREQFYETNYQGTMNVINACRENRVKRLVYVSSPSVVFHYEDELDIDERYPHPDTYANLYCETKGLAETAVLKANGKDGLTTVAIRPHALWGPRDFAGFLPRVLAKIRKGKLKKIVTPHRVLTDITYVENAADACLLAGEKKAAAGKVYFITDENRVNPWEFFDMLCAYLRLPRIRKTVPLGVAVTAAKAIDCVWKLPFLAGRVVPPITRYAVGVITTSTTYDISAAKKDLGYRPKVDSVTGLKRLKQWIEATGGLNEYLNKVR